MNHILKLKNLSLKKATLYYHFILTTQILYAKISFDFKNLIIL